MLSLILLAGSLLASAALWLAGMPFFFLFLFIPLIPFLSRPRMVKRCPLCGFETADPRTSFCPYDGAPLMAPASP
ncbi:MAG: hypothetical protein A4E36_01550 [Methanoregulaceae archaeon PtaB.Bin009]|nr:MAG: hypothetical protein A4E36_01550 [Methanoregulaceae archaeon PtaB.Bin009]OPY41841.1 MAG: hypothetical protein A4E41_00660 [Methanoregulaceae archaeon PtaU1.Bin066]